MTDESVSKVHYTRVDEVEKALLLAAMAAPAAIAAARSSHPDVCASLSDKGMINGDALSQDALAILEGIVTCRASIQLNVIDASGTRTHVGAMGPEVTTFIHHGGDSDSILLRRERCETPLEFARHLVPLARRHDELPQVDFDAAILDAGWASDRDTVLALMKQAVAGSEQLTHAVDEGDWCMRLLGLQIVTDGELVEADEMAVATIGGGLWAISTMQGERGASAQILPVDMWAHLSSWFDAHEDSTPPLQ